LPTFDAFPVRDVFLNSVLDEAIDPERTIQIGMRGSLSPYWDFSREAGMRLAKDYLKSPPLLNGG